MRLARLLLTLAVSTAPLIAAPARAQSAPAGEAPLPCSGQVNIIRVSTIKPGMMSKFLQAVEAQKAWYKKAGGSDQIGVMRVMEEDPATKTYKLSETRAITTHIMPAERKPVAHDADWDAFVAMFSASSTIEHAYLACMDTQGEQVAAQ